MFRILKFLEEYSLTADLKGNQQWLIQSDDITLGIVALTGVETTISGFCNQRTGNQKMVHYTSLEEVDFNGTETAIVISDGVKKQVFELYGKGYVLI